MAKKWHEQGKAGIKNILNHTFTGQHGNVASIYQSVADLLSKRMLKAGSSCH